MDKSSFVYFNSSVQLQIILHIKFFPIYNNK